MVAMNLTKHQSKSKSIFKQKQDHVVNASTVKEMKSLFLLSCSLEDYSYHACEAVDVIRLCYHASVLRQCQMNFCTPIPSFLFKLACRPCPFSWACRLLGNASISCGCDTRRPPTPPLCWVTPLAFSGVHWAVHVWLLNLCYPGY